MPGEGHSKARTFTLSGTPAAIGTRGRSTEHPMEIMEISWTARYVIEPKRCGTWRSFPNACLGLLVYGRNFSRHRLWMLGGCPQSHDTLVVLAIAVSNKAQAAAMQ